MKYLSHLHTHSTSRKQGYTLVEVLVAASLLGMMIGGAVKTVGTMNLAESTAHSGNVALNLTETAAGLWQFGLTTDEVLSVMPVTTNNEFLNNSVIPDGSGNTVRFPSASTTVTLPTSMGAVESIDVATYLENPIDATKYRTITINVVRD